MGTTLDEFPHHGEHLANDSKQAEITLALLTLFVLAAFVAVLLW